MALGAMKPGVWIIIYGCWMHQFQVHRSKGETVEVQPIKTSPGLYYHHHGEVEITSTTWKLVTYVNLKTLDEKFRTVTRVGFNAVQTCKERLEMMNISKTECNLLSRGVAKQVEKLKETRSLIHQLTRTEQRQKRGALNFVGEISKILFGTLDEADAMYYKTHIDEMESRSERLLKLTKEQVAVVRATLSGLNQTVDSITTNEQLLKNSMSKLEQFITYSLKTTDQGLKRIAAFMTINEHLIQLQILFNELSVEYEQLVSAIVHAQKGILAPHIVNPVQMVKYLRQIQADLRDVRFPIPLVEEYGYILLKVMDLNVFVNQDMLGYVINIPLIENNEFHLYKLIPLPIKVTSGKDQYVYIQPEKDYLLVDSAKKLYAKVLQNELECKEVDKQRRICKQTFVLSAMYDHEDCEVGLLQDKQIPTNCVKKMITLNRSLWTHLSANEWLYVAPKEEGMTVLCNSYPSQDIHLTGMGIIKFKKSCKGYGSHIYIQSDRMLQTNHSRRDILPDIDMSIDCCHDIETKLNISGIQLELPLRHVTSNLDDLKVAGKRLDEIDKFIDKEQQQLERDKMIQTYSMTTYLCITVIVIIIIFFICSKCNWCKAMFKALFETMGGGNCCRSICVRPPVVHTPEATRVPLRVREREENVVIYERQPEEGIVITNRR